MALTSPSSVSCWRGRAAAQRLPSPAGGRLLPVARPRLTPSSLSWASLLADASISSAAVRLVRSRSPLLPPSLHPQDGLVRAAWTRRSRGESEKQPNRKSWKRRTDMYMRPFLLNAFSPGDSFMQR